MKNVSRSLKVAAFSMFGFGVVMGSGTLIGERIAHAEETTMEKVGATTDGAKNATKETVRDVKDKACEMVNGKMECVGKKIKHKAQNVKDSATSKAKELKNKVD